MDDRKSDASAEQGAADSFAVKAPTLSLPKGGGAIRGMGEKFAANPVTGTGSISVPIGTSPGRGGFGPQLSLSYDSGAGNGPFGLGWHLSLPAISIKTDKGLPRYRFDEESDVFLLAGAEDLVPVLDANGNPLSLTQVSIGNVHYQIKRYRPRIEGLFALIERWTVPGQQQRTFWRSISRDNVTSWYGRTSDSRIADPADATRIFQWLICETHDDKGNVAVYDYLAEDSRNVATTSAHEANRNKTPNLRLANRYLHKIRYGNVTPFLPSSTSAGLWPSHEVTAHKWLFEVVLDYGQCDQDNPLPIGSQVWPVREDPFSSYRAGFEVRTYRLCRRVLMFHHFEELRRDIEQDTTRYPIANYLVRSTEFNYAKPLTPVDPAKPGYTVLESATQRSYQWISNPNPALSAYQSRQLPPVKFSYSQPDVDPSLQTLAPSELDNLPVGTQGPGYQWVDLDGEGLSGVLTEQAGAWHYKPNHGEGKFGPMRVVARQPAMAALAGGRQQLLDLAGNGEIDLVDFSGPTPGFHERDQDEGWKRHVPFAFLPNIDWADANLRFIDLTGDGHADVLITENEVFTWYPSLDERGFGPSERTRQPLDEEDGPRLVFADGTQTIFLADMCGDGLTALVRIRNGEVCYWPNLGYGRFGAKVTLDNAPVFDHPDLYDPHRIRLADIDGSGPIDLIYLGRDGARLYFNRSGNSLSDPLTVPLPIATENLSAVQVADLMGNGTACLVWNSHLPADARSPVRYLKLMAKGKPHLLIKVENNLGGSTDIEYTPSTHFYIADKLAGTPWITRLPFPVHCVSKVTAIDQWRGTKFSSSYSYHHGYFDGVEREFRGFGRVEQLDVESYDKSTANNIGSPWVTDDHTLYQPPVKSVTWYHTGAALDRQRILDQFEHEYFPQRFAARLPNLNREPNAFHEKPLPQPELPAGIDTDEWREALRACKGMVLRQEVYELDVDDLTGLRPKHTPVRLFSAATHNCNIQRIQPRGANKHAIFLVTESEALTYHYELDLHGSAALTPDPRIAHTLNLRHDDHGNPQQSVAIGYARWRPGDFSDLPRPDLIAQVQSELHIAYSETRYTQDVLLPDPATPTNEALRHHRLRLPWEVRTYEITGLAKPVGTYFDINKLRQHALCEDSTYPAVVPTMPPGQLPIALAPLQYHQQASSTGPHRRIVEHARTRFFDDASDTAPPDKARLLPFGQHGPRGFKYEDYKLALTSELLRAVIGSKLLDPVNGTLTARQILDDPKISGYIHGADIAPAFTGQYWMRSGTAGFAAQAHRHFYLPNEFTDPFDNKTTLTYDGNYDLFIQSSKDALGNTSGIWLDEATSKPRFDYRVLAPIEMVDANGNHSEAVFDVRGLVVAAAVKGKKVNGAWEADHLDGWTFDQTNPQETAVAKFCLNRDFDAAQVLQARTWLGTATARFVYHFGEGRGINGNFTGWMVRPAGACGIAREKYKDPASKLQVSLECSDGSGAVLMKKAQAEAGPVTEGGPVVSPRWIINGLMVMNNKGKPVKQYEPAFSADFGCELPQANGVTPIMYYDAAGRMVRTESPDGTVSRVEFSPWFSRSFDANDTILEPGNRWYAEHSATTASAEDKRAARLAAAHADTPSQTHLDSLGREVIAIAHNRTNGVDEKYLTFTKLDAEGKPLWIRDARGNLVMQYITPPKPTRLAATPPNPADLSDTVKEYVPADSVPCYDIAGNLLHQHSMDAGDRWMLMDAAGKPMLAWDENDKGAGTPIQKRLYRTEYDALHRPTAQHLKLDGADALIEAFDYCDTADSGPYTLVEAQQRNLIGQAISHRDPSGEATVERIDLTGKPAHITRTLIRADAGANDGVVDWNAAGLLDDETFHQITEYDALGRMTRLYNWHRDITFATDGTTTASAGTTNRVAVYVPEYNLRGLLVSEWLHLRASKATVDGVVSLTPSAVPKHNSQAIKKITYNAKGQKLTLTLDNGTTTRYAYDQQTFRLAQLYTRRNASAFTGDCAGDPHATRPARPCGLQNLHYTYDPVGNITHIQDDAQDAIFFNGQFVEPSNDYTYDAIYRLIEGTGRENNSGDAVPPASEGRWPAGNFSSADSLRNYTQRYVYDAVGNFVEMQHYSPDSTSRWTRHYSTESDSNRLDQTWYGSGHTGEVTYRHDLHGNMLNLNQTPEDWGMDIRWDWRDMIRGFDCIGGGNARYHYGIDKQRTRKHITRIGGVVQDRIYLGGYELYRRRNSETGPVLEEIESLHLFEGEQRVLLMDDVLKTDRTHATSGIPYQTKPIIRYQYSNHLGSASLELDELAEIISYEEHHPYGTSAYRLMKSGIEAPPKRYRYTGMERDEESGLNYHEARYLSALLARWISVDPLGIGDGVNLFRYGRCNPVSNTDGSGLQTQGTVGTTRGIAQSKRSAAAEKTRLLGDMARRPEQYPNVSEETKAAMRAERAALDAEAGRLEQYASIESDFHKSVGLPVTIAGGAAVIFFAAGGLAAGGAVLEAGWSLGSLYVRGLMVGISETVAALKTTGSLTTALYTAALNKQLLGTSIVVTELVLTADQPYNPAATLSGPANSVAAEARMAKEELVATSKNLFRRVVADFLESKGKAVTEEAISSQSKRLTLGMLQGSKNGERMVLVSVNNPNFYRSLEKVAAQEGFTPVMGDAFVDIGAQGYPLARMRFQHAEPPLISASNRLSLTDPEMASSNLGCWECQWSAIEGGVTHVNPKPIDQMR